MKTFPRLVNLDGYIAKHWSLMKVGEEYEARIQLKHKTKSKFSGKYQSRTRWHTYYLIKKI